jgi:hypothetical protein
MFTARQRYIGIVLANNMLSGFKRLRHEKWIRQIQDAVCEPMKLCNQAPKQNESRNSL